MKTRIWKKKKQPHVYCGIIYIAKIEKQPKCPSMEEWIRKMWSISISTYLSIYHNGILFIKKNEVLPFATTWVELEGIKLSDVSQAKKDKYHTISLIRGIKKTKQNQAHR